VFGSLRPVPKNILVVSTYSSRGPYFRVNSGPSSRWVEPVGSVSSYSRVPVAQRPSRPRSRHSHKPITARVQPPNTAKLKPPTYLSSIKSIDPMIPSRLQALLHNIPLLGPTISEPAPFFERQSVPASAPRWKDRTYGPPREKSETLSPVGPRCRKICGCCQRRSR
jgi:hypothetical protein